MKLQILLSDSLHSSLSTSTDLLDQTCFAGKRRVNSCKCAPDILPLNFLLIASPGKGITTTIFISCPEKFTIDKYMQRQKLTIKIEHSHLEIAKAYRAKWLLYVSKVKA